MISSTISCGSLVIRDGSAVDASGVPRESNRTVLALVRYQSWSRCRSVNKMGSLNGIPKYLLTRTYACSPPSSRRNLVVTVSSLRSVIEVS